MKRIATTQFRIIVEMRSACRALVGEPEGNNLEDLGIGRRMILKWVINRLKEWLTMESGGRMLCAW
jgi:hypothetical protein